MTKEQDAHAASRRDGAESLRALRELLNLDDVCLEALYDAYLDTARRVFGLRTGVVGAIEGDAMVFLCVRSDVPVPFLEGASRPLDTLFVSLALKQHTSLLCHHIAAHESLRAHPIYLEGNFETYAAAPIRVGSTIFGVLSLLDPEPRDRPFDEADRAFLELLADTLGRAIERAGLETRRREAETKRREANVMFSAAFANAPIGMALVGLDGHLLEVNKAACALFGYSEAELLKLDFQSITYPADLPGDLEMVQALLAGKAKDYQIEKRYVRPGGEVVWAQLNATLVRFEDGTPRCFVSQIQDISTRRSMSAELAVRQAELEEANSKLLQLAAHDPLTGTLNRRALRQRLDADMQDAQRTGAPLGFIMVDVDHFKAYNDAHGHLEGDFALKVVAQCLMTAARESDAVGRFGGEEFLLVLPNTSETDAKSVAERLLKRIAASRDLRWPLTVSAGVHVLRTHGEHVAIDRPIARADEALYRAKQNGRNRVEVA
ncbi:sensor domain-containing diguanylate cyclase [Aquabacter cavernae]|uniref:GGDEF domain-containing protein n=1 Tax=Aquabacter cavernae TaxID=2496029 RepID=UPI0013DFBEC7|nr:sensor domain-containing diguanylate cyclase [Aquabacter cavernae]